MAKYQFTFTDGRIGRSRGNEPVILEAKDDANLADNLADQLYRIARKKLISQGIEAVVDIERGTFTVYAGFQVGAKGTFGLSDA